MSDDRVKHIITPRLLLRPTTQDDGHLLYQAMDVSRKELLEWMPWAKSISLEYAEQFARYCEISWQKKEQNNFPFIIQRRSDNQVIGGLGFNEYSQPQKGVFEMGYWISTAAHGQGFASEAALALSHYAFDRLNPATLLICVQKGNDPSIKIPLKLGYELELTRQKACRHCATHQIDDFHVFACTDRSKLLSLDYEIAKLSEPRQTFHYDLQGYFNSPKNPMLLMTTEDYLLLPARPDDLFQLQEFINRTPTFQGKYPWSKFGKPQQALKYFLQKSLLTSQYLSDANDFWQMICCRKSRKVLGFFSYHIRDRSVPFVNLSPFWDQSEDSAKLFSQVLPLVESLLKNIFGELRLEILASKDQAVPIDFLMSQGFVNEGSLRNYWRNCDSMQPCDSFLFVKNTLIS